MKAIGILACLLYSAAALAAPGASEQSRKDARDIFSSIIGFETSTGMGQVPKMAQYLADRFVQGNFPASDVHIVPFGETASLIVRFRGNGTGGRPIALMAHMDVVTAKRSDWKRDPFRLAEENGFFYGRGTLDIKNEVALLTETFLQLKAQGFVPSRDLIIVFTGDEETEEVTVQDLLDHHRELVDAEYALNGDGGGGIDNEDTGRPQIFELQGAEKTYADFSLTARNPGGHSSRPRPDNAIYELSTALLAIQRYKFPVMSNSWTVGDFRATGAVTPGPAGSAMARFAAHPHDLQAAQQISEDLDQAAKLRTTCVATMLAGGHALNALPQSASANINCRIFPGVSPASVQQTLQSIVGSRIEIRLLNDPLVSDASPMRADVVSAVKLAVASIHSGVIIVPSMSSGASDGAAFRKAGIPTYGVCSAFMKESEDFSHGLDERILVQSFYDGLVYWDTLLRAVAGAH